MVTRINDAGAPLRDPILDPRAEPVPHRPPRDWTWLNWSLALLTGPAAVVLMMLTLGTALNAGGCSAAGCPDLGPYSAVFDIVFYGAATVACVTIAVSFLTATRPLGILVVLGGWGLLFVDTALLEIAFGG